MLLFACQNEDGNEIFALNNGGSGHEERRPIKPGIGIVICLIKSFFWLDKRDSVLYHQNNDLIKHILRCSII